MLTDARPTIPEFRDPRLRPAVAVSLLLHLGLALALGRIGTQQLNANTEAVATSIAVVTVSPQRRRAALASSANEAPTTTAPDPPAATNPVDDVPPANTELTTVSDVPSPPPIPTGEGELVLNQQTLQSSIESFLTTYRSDSLEQDLRKCQQYRDRYARWDCPQGDEPKTATQARIDESMEDTFRDWVYGRDLNVAITEKLMTEMLTLRSLMQEEGVMGDVARDLEFLKAAEYGRLTGNIGDNSLPTGPLPSATGGTITVLSIGLGGLTLPNGVTIGWDGKVHEAPRAPAPRPSGDD